MGWPSRVARFATPSLPMMCSTGAVMPFQYQWYSSGSTGRSLMVKSHGSYFQTKPPSMACAP